MRILSRPTPNLVPRLRACSCGGRTELRRCGTKFYVTCSVCDYETVCYATDREAAEIWNSGKSAGQRPDPIHG